MVNVGLLVLLEAKEGKEQELAEFLESALPLAESEEGTVVWYALRSAPGSFSIFDAFADDDGRNAHLSGPIAAALMGKADELLASPPDIRQVDVLASKTP